MEREAGRAIYIGIESKLPRLGIHGNGFFLFFRSSTFRFSPFFTIFLFAKSMSKAKAMQRYLVYARIA